MAMQQNCSNSCRPCKAIFAFSYAMRFCAYRFFYWFYSFKEMNRNAQRGVSAEVTALFAPDLALQYVTDILGCLLGIAGLVSK